MRRLTWRKSQRWAEFHKIHHAIFFRVLREQSNKEDFELFQSVYKNQRVSFGKIKVMARKFPPPTHVRRGHLRLLDEVVALPLQRREGVPVVVAAAVVVVVPRPVAVGADPPEAAADKVGVLQLGRAGRRHRGPLLAVLLAAKTILTI